MVSIRTETAADHAAVHRVVDDAFSGPEEATLVEALREGPDFVPDLSLVATLDDAIVGHAICSEADVPGLEPGQLLVLGPVAVDPDYQRQGIGSRLVETGLDRARDAGYTGVVLLGSPAYYPRFGFRPAADFGLENPWDAPDHHFQAVECSPGSLADAAGLVEPPAAFDAV